jgi:hypothetical protein
MHPNGQSDFFALPIPVSLLVRDGNRKFVLVSEEVMLLRDPLASILISLFSNGSATISLEF